MLRAWNEAVRSPGTVLKDSGRQSNRRILVVDDDPDIRDLLTDVLLDEGYQVLSAGDGQQALNVLEETKPDLIILDLMMPVMDGWQFYEVAKQRGFVDHIPVIIMSAINNPQATAMSLQAAGYVAKPFVIDTLVTEVRKHVKR